MRAVMRIGSLAALVVTLGCGEQSANDGGVDVRADVEESGADGSIFCTYSTCDGSALCALNTTCPVGDGCNVCVCRMDPQTNAPVADYTARGCVCCTPSGQPCPVEGACCGSLGCDADSGLCL